MDETEGSAANVVVMRFCVYTLRGQRCLGCTRGGLHSNPGHKACMGACATSELNWHSFCSVSVCLKGLWNFSFNVVVAEAAKAHACCLLKSQ